jgi:UDP-N-acetylenolpyruvoylglucosamine reductase
MNFINAPTTSVGWIVEHVLHMNEYRVGNIFVYPKHHNFIVNEGNGTAKDYLTIMKKIIVETKEKLGISLRPEIFLLGFAKKELEGIV